MSDYVPALDEGLALDYGPAPDNEAARDYGKALGYDTPPAGAQAQDVTPAPDVTPAARRAPDPLIAPVTPAQDVTLAQEVTPAAGRAPDPLIAPVTTLATAAAQPPAAEPPAVGPAGDAATHPAPGPAAGPAVDGPLGEEPWAPGHGAAWVSPATYWRRRVVALVVGIAVLTVLAWAVSGVLHGTGTGQATGHGKRSPAQPAGAHRHGGSNRSGRHHGNGSHAARGSSPQSLPAPGQAANRTRTTGASPRHSGPGTLSGTSDVLTAAGSQRQATAAAYRTAPARSMARAPGRQAVPPARGPRAPQPRIAPCARGDVVLSLVSPRYWYERGRWPLFGVAAVSSGNRPCRFDMGSRSATVVVTSGRNRIWGSADCVRGTGSQPVVLHRGMPAVRWIYWDRATSVPGCRRPGRPVRPGAYTAIAFDGQLSSQVMVFLLGRPGTFLP